MRRFLTAAALVALVSVSAACTGPNVTSSPGSAMGGAVRPSGAASASASPSASPSTDVAATTKAVCDKVLDIVSKDNFTPLGEQLGKMIVARQSGDKAAETAAMTRAKEIADGLAKQVRDLKDEAADPKVDEALDTAADGIRLFGTAGYLTKINKVDDLDMLTNDFTTAVEPLSDLC